MAATDFYLLLQKNSEATAKSSGEWGVVVTSMPPLVATEAKDAENNNWMDEDGLDVYDAPVAYMKEFEVEVGLACRGTASECAESYTGILNYMTHGGTEMKVFTTWLNIGKGGVYFVKCSPPEISHNMLSDGTTEFVWCWNMTLRVTKPNSIVIRISDNGTIKLIENG